MNKYFLVVDSVPATIEVEALGRESISKLRLLVTSSGTEAINAVRQIHPPAVLINFRLNDMTGIQCIRRIRALKSNWRPQLYLYNDVVNINLISNANDAGADGVFLMDERNLTPALDTVLRKFGM